MAELLRADDVRANSGDRNNVPFVEDTALDERFRSRLEDFRGSGYDRGHLAPAADHKRSQTQLEETFSLSNISPQVGAGMNRDYWARLEKYVKDLTKRFDDVHVITGPLFLPQPRDGRWRMQHDFIGEPPRLVSVPTHFFKVILARGGKGGAGGDAFAAFVVPNAPVPPDTPLTRCVVPLRELEEAAGLKFFPAAEALRSEEAREALAEAEHAWLAAAQPERHAQPLIGDGKRRLLLLPPPEAGAKSEAKVGTDGAPATPLAVVKAPVPAPMLLPPRQAGAPAPLCTVDACVLPAANWWAASKAKAAAAARE